VNEELRERWKMEVTDSTFEDMIDQLEKSSGDYPEWFISDQIFVRVSFPVRLKVPGRGSMASQRKESPFSKKK
jgi:hypothetical protein